MPHEFVYAGQTFTVVYDPADKTGLVSIDEMVNRDVYGLRRFVNQQATLIDIGANLGIPTLIMAKFNPEATVYAFEPNKKVYEMLVENARINALHNVKAYNLAVTNSQTLALDLTITAHLTGAGSTYADKASFAKQWKDDIRVEQVSCTSLDKVLRSHGINEVYLLKMDCEGAEFDIIYDSELFKQRVVKNLIGEFHDLSYNRTANNSRELIEYCRQYVDGCVDVTVLRF